MRIKIAERLHPFSHEPGTCFVLPGTTLRFQVFPAFVRIHDLSQKESVLVSETHFDVRGPVKDFTIEQDLEHAVIRVWGHTTLGFMRYKFIPNSRSTFQLSIEKQPEGGLGWQVNTAESDQPMMVPSTARLSLGLHKAQDWTLLRRRCDMAEIFPSWFRLGQLTPLVSSKHYPEGTMALLENCRDAIIRCARLDVLPAFRNLFLAGFSGGLSPRLTDDQHQGFLLPPALKEQSPLPLLSEGAHLIQSLFVQTKSDSVDILPVLPPDFHSGRILGVKCSIGEIDLEWSKKTIRRLILRAKSTQQIKLNFQKEIARFRLRQSLQDRGHVFPVSSSIHLEIGRDYFLDRFEK